MHRPVLFFALFLLVGCSASRAYETPATYTTEVDGSSAPAADRKVLYSADLRVVVPEPDSAVVRAVALARSYGGFMSTTTSTSATVRVPADRFEEALAAIGNFGKVRSRNVYGRDVTDEYYDLGIRLDNARKARDSYLELLASAETVEATLAVERELERLNEVIDRFSGQRQRLEELERFATITASFTPKPKLGPLGAVFKGGYEGVRWLFVRK